MARRDLAFRDALSRKVFLSWLSFSPIQVVRSLFALSSESLNPFAALNALMSFSILLTAALMLSQPFLGRLSFSKRSISVLTGMSLAALAFAALRNLLLVLVFVILISLLVVLAAPRRRLALIMSSSASTSFPAARLRRAVSAKMAA